MVEALQMFLFLFKSKYRRKCSWFSPFLCSVLIVLLFCQYVTSKCSASNCVNGVCRNETCECLDGWQGPGCQYCGGKIRLTELTGVITDGPSNYSISLQCSWLIAPNETFNSVPAPIRIRLESFATECGWDHVYIYDGDSVRAEKLLAVFSGVLRSESSWTRQVVARSGRALVHFFSDDAFAMEGFNITYAVNACPSDDAATNCSNHGTCADGVCTCDPEYIGIACDELLCPDNCNEEYNYGACTPSGCVCSPPRAGADCSRDRADAGWAPLWREPGDAGGAGGRGVAGGQRGVSGLPPPVAGHALLEYEGDLLRVGGESFGDAEFLYRYSTSNNSWSVVEAANSPAPRYLHSAVMWGHEMIVFGGLIVSNELEKGGGLAGLEGRAGDVTNELWRLDLSAARPAWRNATPLACSARRAAPAGHCGGLHVSGHSAVVVERGEPRRPVMLVFFGYSPHYGYLHMVQEYHLDEGAWSAGGAPGWTRGGFAHSAALDPLSGRVYVHAGAVSHSEAQQGPSAALHEYDVESRRWRTLPAAYMPRYLHTGTIVSPGVMLVFGGNAHNDSAASPGAVCYSAAAILYNIRCARWLAAPQPEHAARAAHAAARLRGDAPGVLVYGGFNGRLRSDALLFTAGAPCRARAHELACVSAREARACVWRVHAGDCVPIEEVGWQESFDTTKYRACVTEPAIDTTNCQAETCSACVEAGCSWCGVCSPNADFCRRHRHQYASTLEECADEHLEARDVCGRLHSCAACHAHRSRRRHGNEEAGARLCYWDYDSVKCLPSNVSDDLRSMSPPASCSPPCAAYDTCANCTAEECIWCASASRCVDKNAYGATFPLGGCRAWSTSASAGSAPCGGGCGALASCAACRAEPACGWCELDGAGRGRCVPGAAAGPHSGSCESENWHFTSCPPCQCNGHATCDAAARCVQPCGGRALGAHCDTCAPHHWGEPRNGAACRPCDCNSQAVSCAPDSGKCYCSTKGLAGERCDKCDVTNHYHADPYNKGACYYDLAVDYQFTFNLSKKEDRHLSAINFRNAPAKPDVDADFTITCSAHARMNLTVRARGEPAERVLFAHVNCTNFKYKFAKTDHTFGVEDNVTLTTFFVYVYDFRPPLWIQISFSQYPKLNLQQFFITFSSCFLLLLLLAAALWKIKQKYDLYRRRQRLFVEMEQMASRPFSQVCVELEKAGVAESGPPAPVALEPCASSRAAVLTLLVRLPGAAPPQGALAVASALVTLGHHAQPRQKRDA